MNTEFLMLLCLGLLIISFLYSSVGQAGASGYIAIMILLGLSPDMIKPVALILNIIVAGIAAWQFYRAGHFNWQIFWPFALLSIPFAFLGGFLIIPVDVAKIIIGIVLLISAALLLIKLKVSEEPTIPRRSVSIVVGAGMGFLAGLIGIGGGIFLTPLLLLFRWARTTTASAMSAVFILVNSISGFSGMICNSQTVPSIRSLAPLFATVIIGGTLGSYFGSRKFSKEIIKVCLACVLMITSIKLIAG